MFKKPDFFFKKYKHIFSEDCGMLDVTNSLALANDALAHVA